MNRSIALDYARKRVGVSDSSLARTEGQRVAARRTSSHHALYRSMADRLTNLSPWICRGLPKGVPGTVNDERNMPPSSGL